MSVDVARVRGLVPALGDGWAHLDAPGATLVPEPVTHAVSSALRVAIAPAGGGSAASVRGASVTAAARAAVADLVGADPAGVVLGTSVHVLRERLAAAVSAGWGPGDEVVVSRLDGRVAEEVWARAAERTGATLRSAEVDVETCELPAWQYDELLGEHTRLVALTAACPHIGTRTEVATVARAVRALPSAGRARRLVVVDASAAAPYLPLDLATLDADVLSLSAAAWGGPPVAALVLRDPDLLDTAAVEGEDLPLALLAGLAPSVEYLAGLDEAARGPRRDRVLTSMRAVSTHLEALTESLLQELSVVPGVTVLGDPPRRIPVVALMVRGHDAAEVAARVADRGVAVSVDPGDEGALGALGCAEGGGAVRIGLAPYTSRADVDALVRALR